MAQRRSVKIRGLRELNRAFRAVDNGLEETLREGLRHAAEPVRVLAERKGLSEISGMSGSPKWAEQHTVVSKRTALVYIAPSRRGTRIPSRKRTNLAGLLATRAMEPALEENEEKVVHDVEAVIDILGRKQGF